MGVFVVDASNLLSRDEIEKRVESKRQRLVNWLRSEGCIDYVTAGTLLGITPSAAYKTLVSAEKDGLLVKHVGNKLSLWSLSMTGALSYLTDADDPQLVFDPRVSEATVRHTLAVQRARLAAEKNGWTNWKSEREIKRELMVQRAAGEQSQWLKLPDAVGTSPSGIAVAIEVERTAKTPKRYRSILGDYLQMRKTGVISAVHYVCEREPMAKGLERLFKSFATVQIAGRDYTVTPEHLGVFSFYGPGQWPEPQSDGGVK